MYNTNVPRSPIAQAIHAEFMDHIEDIELSVEAAKRLTEAGLLDTSERS